MTRAVLTRPQGVTRVPRRDPSPSRSTAASSASSGVGHGLVADAGEADLAQHARGAEGAQLVHAVEAVDGRRRVEDDRGGLRRVAAHVLLRDLRAVGDAEQRELVDAERDAQVLEVLRGLGRAPVARAGRRAWWRRRRRRSSSSIVQSTRSEPPVPRWSTATMSYVERSGSISSAKSFRIGRAAWPGPPLRSTSVPVRVPVAGQLAVGEVERSGRDALVVQRDGHLAALRAFGALRGGDRGDERQRPEGRVRRSSLRVTAWGLSLGTG